MSYMLAIVIASANDHATTSQVGPFTEKTSCKQAAREMITDGIELKETDDMVTGKVVLSTSALGTSTFYYRLNCVRQ